MSKKNENDPKKEVEIEELLVTSTQKLCLNDNLDNDDHNTQKQQQQQQIDKMKDMQRNSVWKFMQDNALVRAYPPSCFGKILNFKGCDKAAEKLIRLQEFRNAKYVKINPSLAQMHLRFLTLRHRKKLLVPSPALGAEFMYVVEPDRLKQFWQFKRASSKAGAKEFGRELKLSDSITIDFYVVASTCCSQNGVRLGKGLGYAELEWAIFHTLGMVSSATVVVTTVHDSQVVSSDKLPTSLMCCHDLPVDIIVTPTRIINVSKKLTKPTGGVYWDLVTSQQIEAMPILKQLKPP